MIRCEYMIIDERLGGDGDYFDSNETLLVSYYSTRHRLSLSSRGRIAALVGTWTLEDNDVRSWERMEGWIVILVDGQLRLGFEY